MEAARLVAELVRRGQTVATAESLTAGLVCAVLTEVPGSSAVVRGGLVVYATDLKESLAGVDGALLAEHGAVHPEVAAQLAEGARTRCGADWGLGLTGVAGPDPQDGVAVGTVFVAVAGAGVRTTRTLRIDGDREAVRRASVTGALGLLGEQLA
ncbi:CinA family protein [Prauserella cavernicola]|uniref:CinA family protein n=1 Tax=Prauserella cavernicola TaxID=2800127 RepID=A0A934V7I1_9PSEU|nr:CinA family protein [Prauserella cavernicola]MBK1788607.1 CinA family protein [Prauserella cavernicola]